LDAQPVKQFPWIKNSIEIKEPVVRYFSAWAIGELWYHRTIKSAEIGQKHFFCRKITQNWLIAKKNNTLWNADAFLLLFEE
jgi:hypothetical protein